MNRGVGQRLNSARFQQFWTEPHLCVVTTLRPDGSPHAVPMGVVVDFDTSLAWAITRRGSTKVANIERANAAPDTAATGGAARLAACQVQGRRWSTLEGRVEVLTDPDTVREAEVRYARRYRTPRHNPERVALRIRIDRVLGNVN